MRRFTYRGNRTRTFWDRLVRTRAGLHVYWNIDVQGSRVVVELGPMGAEGLKRVHKFASEDEARDECERMIRERLAEGYIEVTPRSPGPVRQALEDALAEDPDDLVSHMAYADHLAELGDPRGEFIQVQLAQEREDLSAKERERLRRREGALLKRHRQEWLGELGEHLLRQGGARAEERCRLARGWLHHLDVPLMAEEFAAALVRAPAARLLRRLVVRSATQNAVTALLEAPWLSSLQFFRFGEDNDACRVTAHRAGLTQLVCRMPRLEELHVLSCGLNLEEVLCPPPGAPSVVPPLRHLRLERFSDGDAVCRMVASSGVLARLKTLELNFGTISDAGAHVLARAPDVARLERLDLSYNMLTDAGFDALRDAGAEVIAEQQASRQEPGDDEDLYEDDWE